MPDTIKMNPEEDWKRELGYVLFARRRQIVSTAVAVMLGAVLVLLFWPPRYDASSSVLVRSKRIAVSPAALDPVELRSPEVSDRDIVSEMEILRSPELARRVTEVLEKNAVWDEGSTRPGVMDFVSDYVKNLPWLHTLWSRPAGNGMAATRKYLSQLEVTRVPASGVIRINLSAGSPQAAEAGLEALLDLYVTYRGEVFNPAGQDEFFAGRMEHYRNQLNELMARISREGGETSPVFIEQRIKGNLERLAALLRQLGELEMELATSAFVENQPLQTRVDILKQMIADLEEESRMIQGQRLEAESVFREAQLISHSFDTFAKRAEEARIADSIAESQLAGEISILSRASGTGRLVFPRVATTLLMGLVVAVFSGISIGFLAEFFDHTVRRPEDVLRNTGLPVVCSLSKV